MRQASADLARLAVGAGDHELASWAAAKGLSLWQLDEDLHWLALDAAALVPDRSALDLRWAKTVRAFASHDQAVPERLAEYYDDLRRGR